MSIHLTGPEGALAALVATPSGGGSEVRVAALTRHHLDDDWVAPCPTPTARCATDPVPGAEHRGELPPAALPTELTPITD